MLVLSNPVPGKEDAFNEWYTDQHLTDVVSVDGFISAQRFRVHQETHRDTTNGWTPFAWQYVAIYEIEGDSPASALQALSAGVRSGRVALSDTMDAGGVSRIMLEPITGVVTEVAERLRDQGVTGSSSEY